MVACAMNFSGRHFPKDVVLTTIRGYVRYNHSYPDVEEFIAERGIGVDHSTVNRWVVKYAPMLAALRFLRQAIRNNGTPVKINRDKSGANTAAIEAYNQECGSTIEIRQCKYLNNIVEQDHRRVKQKTRAALGFKALYSAHATLQGVELIQMIRKGQVRPIPGGSLIEQFNHLAM